MMFLCGDECIEVYMCVGCNSIAIKDIELNRRDECKWYREEPLSDHAVSEVGELLACPFCGNPAKKTMEAMGIDGEYTTCSNRDCTCHSYLFLVDDWNKRANFR
jgi:hypothetical protein